MKAPEPMPSVPILNLRSRSIRELRFASRIALTLWGSSLSAWTIFLFGTAYISSVFRILLTRFPLTCTISSQTLW